MTFWKKGAEAERRSHHSTPRAHTTNTSLPDVGSGHPQTRGLSTSSHVNLLSSPFPFHIMWEKVMIFSPRLGVGSHAPQN